ncbi:CAG2 [Auxenochlorella protothecoides x Auxenochlorella symbiontica]|uniref:Gamma carbonic anhydrase-like 1, mitochondrial n=1 Tax=Auxenochlorella protothecoides TaxID=3075 RepID=A0A1D1ZZF2_AUXPR|nr:hypothetical protein APUTEX25_004455 [Auxenochlorella protothecoides]|eukprot:RMZ56031.1 hypothetical protein APUTEX25_004455 [Auxenochlorella protothecoides]
MALRRASAQLWGRCLAVQRAEFPGAAAQRVFTTSSSSHTSIHIEEEVYNRQRQLIPLGNRVPSLAPDAWVAPSAVVIGDVDLYDQASIWYGAVLRGDLNTIKVGAFSNVQDRTVIHAASSSPTGLPAATTIGHYVTVGQGCLLRSVTLEDQVVVGDRCVLLEGSLVERQSVLAPGSVLPPGRRVPAGELWAGNPARFVRKLSRDEAAGIVPLANSMAPAVDQHASEFTPVSFAYTEAEALRAILKPGAALADAAALGDGSAIPPQPLPAPHKD